MNVQSQEFLRFIVVGIINTINYYLVYLFLHIAVQVPYLSAHVVGFGISMILSFFLNAYYTFNVQPTWWSFIRFPLSQFFNLCASSLFMYVFVDSLEMNSVVAPILAVLFTVPLTFIITAKILKG